ncbi:MAG: hypothetical protein KatS3mg115_1170 [Candidatus Poribacteria bacterium]|nr:MAG: hypothetical protein KatS3mg115_1170 [Candidatus Poribacteria bacterium]
MMLRAHRVLQKHLLHDHTIGTVREIHVRSLSPHSINPEAPLHWRQRRDLSGLNVLDLGILYEMLARYLGHARSVAAQTRVWTSQRFDPETGQMRIADVPETVHLFAEMESGALAVWHLSSVAAFSGSPRVEIYGSEGTFVLDLPRQKVLGARLENEELDEVPVPPELEYGWRVERDFIEAIREGKPIELTTFEEGVRYMAFTEAVHVSALTGRRITI